VPDERRPVVSLGVALVGCGAIAHVHVPAIQESPSVTLVGVYDRDPARAHEVSREYGVSRVFESWADALADPAVDVVDLLLPHDLHRDFAVEALAAGKHTVVEKPLATTLEEIDHMRSAAMQAGRYLIPCHTRLYESRTEKMSELLGKGAIGDVYMAQSLGLEPPSIVAARPWLGSGQGGGGVLIAQSVHIAYLMRHFAGEVAEVSAFRGGRKVVQMVDEDTAVVILRFASGAVGEMLATFGQTVGPYGHAIILYGTEGYLGYGLKWVNEQHVPELFAVSPKLYGDRQLHLVEMPDEPRHATFTRMWTDFGAAIAEGRRARVTDEDGRKAVEIILAAYRAADEDRTVRLPL
jgi:UDP-N-acetyl-2-amino-2-deoxyglucuronate dehydrogenase